MEPKFTQINTEEFWKYFEGNEDIISTLIETFLSDYSSILKDIENSIAAQDGNRLEKLAHELKGMVSIFYATELAKNLELLEAAGRNKKTEGVDSFFQKITLNLELLKQEFKLIESKLKNSN